ncbi:MAG TPA: polysaccharide biosynthesis/export family protein [Methylomirabilota bacterium]|nr:polysaccharide biosynthesis/export family protein [Methylomirabilota bacterium]
MKLFFHGLFVCLGLLASMTLTGCDTTSNNSLFSLDTPKQSAPPNVARFRVGQTVIAVFSGTLEAIPAHEEMIKENGTITLPLIGPIYAAGKTAGELQDEIYTNYVPKYYVRLNVTVKSGDRVYYVGGEVGHSGIFQYVGDTTVTKAIQAAGSLTPYSSHRKIWVVRASNGQRIKVNYDEALQNPAKDPQIWPDDQITVDRSIW